VFWPVLVVAAERQPEITVRIYNYADAQETVLEKAKTEARRLLRTSAFDIRWIDCPVHPEQRERYRGCADAVSPADIVLRLVPRSMEPKEDLEHALGFSLPFGGQPATRAYVLYDRVREKVRRYEGISEFSLVAYVMAHEIAHLLIGDDRHSPRGVMKAGWRQRELIDIERGIMSFSRDELRLIETGVIQRLQARRPE
jgi:hypothetical protein